MAASSATELRSTIFVGNIAVFCSEADLHAHFARCGEILEVRLARSEDHSKHLSYGFVRYSNLAGAQLAIRTLNDSLLCGRPLKVDWAQSRADRSIAKAMKKPPHPTFNSASVHVTFLSHQIHKIINEETLRFLFSSFGTVTDVIITKHNINEAAQKQSGYGFVHFPLTTEGINSAVKMSKTVTDLLIDDVNYRCKLSHDMEQRLSPHHRGNHTPNSSPASSPYYSLPEGGCVPMRAPMYGETPPSLPPTPPISSSPRDYGNGIVAHYQVSPFSPASPALRSSPLLYASPLGSHRSRSNSSGMGEMGGGRTPVSRTSSHGSSTFRYLMTSQPGVQPGSSVGPGGRSSLRELTENFRRMSMDSSASSGSLATLSQDSMGYAVHPPSHLMNSFSLGGSVDDQARGTNLVGGMVMPSGQDPFLTLGQGSSSSVSSSSSSSSPSYMQAGPSLR